MGTSIDWLLSRQCLGCGLFQETWRAGFNRDSGLCGATTGHMGPWTLKLTIFRRVSSSCIEEKPALSSPGITSLASSDLHPDVWLVEEIRAQRDSSSWRANQDTWCGGNHLSSSAGSAKPVGRSYLDWRMGVEKTLLPETCFSYWFGWCLTAPSSCSGASQWKCAMLIYTEPSCMTSTGRPILLTLARLWLACYWPRMTGNLRRLIRGCKTASTCQAAKHNATPSMRWLYCRRLWQTLTRKLVEPMPDTERANRSRQEGNSWWWLHQMVERLGHPRHHDPHHGTDRLWLSCRGFQMPNNSSWACIW